MPHPDCADLKRLVQAWVAAGFSGLELLRDPSFEPTVPAALLDTITRRDEDRARVLGDAPYWLMHSRPFGVGLDVEILPCAESQEPGGRRVIGPLRYRLGWQDRMAAEYAQVSEATYALHQVAWEEGAWRLVRIWNEDQSRRYRDEIDQARKILRNNART